MAEPPAPRSDAASAPPDAPPGAIRLGGSIGRADVDAVCARACRSLVGGPPGALVCDVGAVEAPALPLIDVLARLALTVHRAGRTLRLERASPEIVELVALCGLVEVVGAPDERGVAAERETGSPSGVESGRQAEQREEALGVEEERDPRDPIALELEDLDRPGREPAVR